MPSAYPVRPRRVCTCSRKKMTLSQVEAWSMRAPVRIRFAAARAASRSGLCQQASSPSPDEVIATLQKCLKIVLPVTSPSARQEVKVHSHHGAFGSGDLSPAIVVSAVAGSRGSRTSSYPTRPASMASRTRRSRLLRLALPVLTSTAHDRPTSRHGIRSCLRSSASVCL